MSNEEVSITEISVDDLNGLLNGSDCIYLNSPEKESIVYHSIGEEGITMEFESKSGEDFLFIFNSDEVKITQNGNKVTIEDPKKPEETCEFLMFKKVPYSG